MSNIIKPSDQADNIAVQNSYIKNTSNFNKLDDRSPYDGVLDKYGEVKLKLAVVDNPEIVRDDTGYVDPLNTRTIINFSTGQIALRWLESPGGIIRPSDVDGRWEHIKSNDKYNPEDREFNEWNIDSRRQQVKLTHSFIWADNKNYCGINYIPPIGSIVVVGFRKQGMPIILGYLPSHFKICYPVLKPGEMTLKGYGNNYIHNRWSDKLDLKAWSQKGQIDIDDPDKQKVNPSDCTLWIRLNANDRYIELSAQESGNGTVENKYNKYPIATDGVHNTKIVLRPRDITITSADSKGVSSEYYQNEERVRITAKEFEVFADNSTITSANNTKIISTNMSITSSNTNSLYSGAQTTIIASANVVVNGKNIYLN